MSDTMTCKGCYGESLPGEHLFDCPTRIRGLEDRIRELEARIAAKDEALTRLKKWIRTMPGTTEVPYNTGWADCCLEVAKVAREALKR